MALRFVPSRPPLPPSRLTPTPLGYIAFSRVGEVRLMSHFVTTLYLHVYEHMYLRQNQSLYISVDVRSMISYVLTI